MNEEKVVKDKILIPVMPLAKMIMDNLFIKNKENFYKKYFPLALSEGKAIMEDMKAEMVDNGDDWDIPQNTPQAKIRNDAMLNTVEKAVRANLEDGFNFAKEIMFKEILTKFREELKK